MASEVYNLKSLYIENTVARQSKSGLLNNKTTNVVFDQPDEMGTYIYSGVTGIYTGETGVGTEYLIQGSLSNNNFYAVTNATFTKGSTTVVLDSPVTSISTGDFIRNDLDLNTSFFEISKVTNGSTGATVELVSPYTSTEVSDVVSNSTCTLRKIKKSRAQFEYAQNKAGNSYIYYDPNKIMWGVTGIGFTGPVTSPTGVYVFPPNDTMSVQFQDPSSTSDPVITVVKSDAFTVVENNRNPVTDIPLPAIPYPHESLKVYISKNKGPLVKATEGKDGDYVVNYSQNPKYVYPFPPQKNRQIGFIKLLDAIDEKQTTIDTSFNGFVSIQKTSVVGSIKDLKIPVTNIIPDSEKITVGNNEKSKNFDYLINYNNGNLVFAGHEYNENLVGSVMYPNKLYWDGVSVIKGAGETGLSGGKSKSTNKNLVIDPISGLEGITGTVYFEDIDKNDLLLNTDYLIEYDSGAFRLNKPLGKNECVLVSYYVEGEDELSESMMNEKVYRTKKFPVLTSSVTLTATYTLDGGDVQRVLSEGVDFIFYYLTGLIQFLGTFDLTTLKKLDISYTPLAQINCILQPNPSESNTYKITIVDDALTTVDSFNLVFGVKNTTISTAKGDPFKRDDDPTKISYDSSVLPNSLLRMGLLSREGFGFAGLSNNEMIALGVTGLVQEGMAKSLGVTDDYFYQQGITGILQEFGGTGDFNVTGYTYDNSIKQFKLDGTSNKIRPDLNDVVVATYSYVAGILPYAPLQAAFPNLDQGATEFMIEGFDRTDILKPEMIIRIDSFDPEQTFYFKIQSVFYDGNNTTVGIYGSVPSDIRIPSFYLFDSDLNFASLPAGSSVDNSAAVGSTTLFLKGNLLELSKAVRNNSLLLANGYNVYTVQKVAIINDTLNVTIFPEISSYIFGEILVSDSIVYNEGDIIALTDLPILLNPQEPGFTVFYSSPTNLDGYCTIVIDTEKIIFREYINSLVKEYFYYFKNYDTAYQLSQAIVNTLSQYYIDEPTIYPKYNPFSLSSDGITNDFYLNVNQ